MGLYWICLVFAVVGKIVGFIGAIKDNPTIAIIGNGTTVMCLFLSVVSIILEAAA